MWVSVVIDCKLNVCINVVADFIFYALMYFQVEYFNNYLRDPKRPQLAEHPGNRQQRKEGTSEREGFSAPSPYVPQ